MGACFVGRRESGSGGNISACPQSHGQCGRDQACHAASIGRNGQYSRPNEQCHNPRIFRDFRLFLLKIRFSKFKEEGNKLLAIARGFGLRALPAPLPPRSRIDLDDLLGKAGPSSAGCTLSGSRAAVSFYCRIASLLAAKKPAETQSVRSFAP